MNVAVLRHAGGRVATSALCAIAVVGARLPQAAAASNQAPGEVIGAVPQARLSREGNVSVLEIGNDVFIGDIVATGQSGEAQVVFPDDTRIVVGPNSQLKVDQAIFRNSTTYRKLSVSAVKGTFRFLSGNSPSRAYSVKTPTATMGVRGTSFDFAVSGRDATDLLVYNGEVQMCGRRARCVVVPGGCNAVRVDRRANFAQPETYGERRSILDRLFPYHEQQSTLGGGFQVNPALCDDEGEDPTAKIRRTTVTGAVVVSPAVKLPPSIESSNGGGGGGGSAASASQASGVAGASGGSGGGSSSGFSPLR